MISHRPLAFWLLSTVVLLGTMSIAAAQSPQAAVLAGTEERFRQFDKNGDGRITREESGTSLLTLVVTQEKP